MPKCLAVDQCSRVVRFSSGFGNLHSAFEQGASCGRVTQFDEHLAKVVQGVGGPDMIATVSGLPYS